MSLHRVRTSLWFTALLTLAGATASFAQLGGPVIIGGDDADDHGSVSGTTNNLGWFYIQNAFNVMAPNVAGSKTKKAVCIGCNGGQASGGFNSGFDQSNLPGGGWTRVSLTTSAEITGFFDGSGATNVNNSGIIYMPTDAGNVSGGINSTQLAIVNPNAGGIKSFVSTGGGLFTHDQQFTSGGFGWLTTVLPGIIQHGAGGCSDGVLNLTSEGQTQFPLLTDAILSNATPWHSWFSGNFGGLEVLVTGPCSGVGNPVIIGGARVSFSLKVAPAFAFNLLGTSHSVTATVKNNAGVPVVGDSVAFAVVSGPNAGAAGTGTTDLGGNASFTYTGNSVVGLDLIRAIHAGAPPALPDTGFAQKVWDNDCQPNGRPDSCDLSCGCFGGAWAAATSDTACGQSRDDNHNGQPDECNHPPDCSNAVASEPMLWPPNHSYHAISILGVSDPDSADVVTITVTGITQDEPTNTRGDGNTCPDAQISGGQASVRAERTGTPGIPGNGRVYAISFTADDGRGGQCSGTVRVCVPHDQGNPTCIDDGQRFNSLGPCTSGNTLAPEAVSLRVGSPVGSQAQISFALPQDTFVDVSIFDVTGRRIATLENGVLTTGLYDRTWNMDGVANGLYFVRLRAGGVTMSKALLRIR